MKKIRSWVDDDKSKSLCELCGKETNDTIRVKIEEQGVYNPVRNICAECVKQNGYVKYDGSDWGSDWN